ncbi:hypothetical protein ARMGADRAFT_1037779 [Armillaria gallica]|uniref:Uncharacterized protein n=1 Tax=Armillaria gallica TaxID=47427 RepID=A0A2H3CWP4_ARMGA|nr:hypothetical protein ARMGADRAFT_1037779 [Armillaria gallica]
MSKMEAERDYEFDYVMSHCSTAASYPYAGSDSITTASSTDPSIASTMLTGSKSTGCILIPTSTRKKTLLVFFVFTPLFLSSLTNHPLLAEASTQLQRTKYLCKAGPIVLTAYVGVMVPDLGIKQRGSHPTSALSSPSAPTLTSRKKNAPSSVSVASNAKHSRAVDDTQKFEREDDQQTLAINPECNNGLNLQCDAIFHNKDDPKWCKHYELLKICLKQPLGKKKNATHIGRRGY